MPPPQDLVGKIEVSLMLSFLHLTVFQTMMRLKSVTYAAETLDLSQSSLSRHLQFLRIHFNDPLFVRTRSGMEPTPVAQLAAAGVAEALAIYNASLSGRAEFDASASNRNFFIAASDLGHLVVLPRLLRAAARIAPHVRFTAVSPRRSRLIAELEAGEVDIAIGSFPNLFAGVREQTLQHEHYACIAPHALATDGSLTLATFKSAQHVVVDGRHLGHIHREVEKEIIAIVGRDNVRVLSESFLLGLHLAQQSDLVLTIPARVATILESASVGVFEPPIALPGFNVKQYWHERFDRDPGNIWLRGMIAMIRQDVAA